MIAVVVDSMERYRFFRRLTAAVREDHEFLFITSEALAHLLFRLHGDRSVFIARRPGEVELPPDADELIARSIDVMAGRLNPAQARLDMASIIAVVEAAFASHKVKQCILWNGQQLFGRTVTALCRQQGISTLFLEIANLPGRLFADCEGVNALSSIARDVRLLDALPAVPYNVHAAWLQGYESGKRQPLPQSRHTAAQKMQSLANFFLKKSSNAVLQNSLSTLLDGAMPLHVPQAITRDDQALIERAYYFLPLQVSGDTQVRLHSDVDNLQAIRRASAMAQGDGCELLIKMHPAETSTALLSAVLTLQSELPFQLVCNPTPDLIRHARRIVTINSTVGLEALLLDKPVTVLGHCVYKGFDALRLNKYIHSFLIGDIDYFGRGPITRAAALHLLARVN